VVGVDDDAIRVLLQRLARKHPSGGTVVERAAVLAAGIGADDVVTWMMAHGAHAEAGVSMKARGGLHGMDRHAGGATETAAPSRYILPAGALD
jgi:hypothetical protein